MTPSERPREPSEPKPLHPPGIAEVEALHRAVSSPVRARGRELTEEQCEAIRSNRAFGDALRLVPDHDHEEILWHDARARAWHYALIRAIASALDFREGE